MKAILDGISALLHASKEAAMHPWFRGIIIRIHWIATSRCELTLDVWEREMMRQKLVRSRCWGIIASKVDFGVVRGLEEALRIGFAIDN